MPAPYVNPQNFRITRYFDEVRALKTKMPELDAGTNYRIEDVQHYLDNVDVTLSHRNEYSSVVGRRYFGAKDAEIVLEYREIPFLTLLPSIQMLHDLFVKQAEHMVRIIRIKNLLMAGEVAWPLLILKGYTSPVCPDCKIQEGMHRAVAHQLISSEMLPLFVMKYNDDTDDRLFDRIDRT